MAEAEPELFESNEVEATAEATEATEELPAHIEENVDILKAYEDTDLLATLKAALESRAAVLQALVDWAVPDRAYVSARLLVENRVCGKIKSFNEASGYGFIDCPAVHDAFGNDAFLHHQQLQNFAVGQEVSFAILLSKEGKPQAFDLGPARNGQDMRKMSDKGHGGYKGNAGGGGHKGGKGHHDGGHGGYRDHRQPDASDGHRGARESRPASEGRMGDNDWAAWTPSTYGRRTDGASWGALPAPPPPGRGRSPPAAFRRNVASNDQPPSDSQPSARHKYPVPPRRDAHSAPPSANDVPGITDRRHEGVLKSFNERNGFGFIENDELKGRYGNDVFVHHAQMGNFRVGQALTFNVFLNKDEKPQAKDIRSANEGSGGYDDSRGARYSAGPPSKRPRW